MLNFLRTGVVYILGCAVFAYVCAQVLGLLGVPARTSLYISVPIGVVAFVIFIWLNWDNDFSGWHTRDGRWFRKGDDDDATR